MSELNIIRLQHGRSNTAANNFTTTAEAANGTMKLLARGNPGATTQDIITVDASGVVDHPQGLKIAGTSGQRMMLTAAKATTSGTAVDFSPADGTGIPSWAKRVTVLFNNVSTNGTSVVEVRIGTSSGIESTGYSSNLNIINTTTVGSMFSATGIPTVTDGLATYSRSGSIVLALQDNANNVWVYNGLVTYNPSATGFPAGRKNLVGQLDRVRITTVNGTDTFDAGSVSLLIEGY